MAMLDTTFIVDLLRGRAGASALLDELEGRGEPLLVPSPAAMELWEGVLECGIRSGERAKIEGLLSAVAVLPFGGRDAARTAEIMHGLSRRGVPVDAVDAMTAGMAMCRGETLVTNDARFARIPGLRMLKY